MGVQSVIMAKGSSMSGASQNVNKGGGGAAGAMSKGARPAGAPAQRQRPQKSSVVGAMVGNNTAGGGILRFYTDDAPGLKIGPVTVLVMSLIYIGCVVLLHIWGKIMR